MAKIECSAWCGWFHFRTVMNGIWSQYQKYGKVVLEKELGEYYEKIEPLFLNAEYDSRKFSVLVRKYWEENYHFVASNYAELGEMFERFEKTPCRTHYYLELLPDARFYKVDEPRGIDENFSLKKDFYESIIKAMYGGYPIYFVTKNRRVFKLEPGENENSPYKKILMLEVKVIKA